MIAQTLKQSRPSMIKILAAICLMLAAAWAYQAYRAEILAHENALQANSISTLNSTARRQALAIVEHELRAIEIEGALTTRNAELRELAQRYDSQKIYLKQLTESDQHAKDFLNTVLPNSIACLFVADPEAAAPMPAANCTP